MVLYPQAERGELDEVKVLKVSVSPKVLDPCTLLLRVSLKALNKTSSLQGGPHLQEGQKKSKEIASRSIFCIFLSQKPEHQSQP